MRFAGIDECEIVNGKGVGVSLYVQGCPIRCEGCFNPETWNFDGGEEWTQLDETHIYELTEKEGITRFSILGGEPLYAPNLFDLFLLTYAIEDDKDIWLWTGYTWEELMNRVQAAKEAWPEIVQDNFLIPLLGEVTYIICGPYIQEERDLTLPWRGSRNQEIIMCQKSMKKGKKILYKENG